MNFNVNDYRGKYVMHCKSKEEYDEFCNVLDKLGMRWNDGSKFSQHNRWKEYKEETCINFNQGKYGNVKWYLEDGYIILEWSSLGNICNTCRNKECGKCCFKKEE